MRRTLLQSGGGVTVNVAIRAAQGIAPSLKNILGYAGPAIGNALAVPFPGFAVGLLAAAPLPAPTSTTWANLLANSSNPCHRFQGETRLQPG